MSFDWTTNPTGVMTRIGQIWKKILTYYTVPNATLLTDEQAIVNLYEQAGASTNQLYIQQIDGLTDTYDSFRSQYVAFRQALVNFITATLLDQDTVLSQLPGYPSDITGVLADLWEQATIDGKTFQNNVVTLGSPAAVTGWTNNGNGFVLLTKLLDGVSSPLAGGAANPKYNKLASELCVPSETQYLLCAADQNGGSPEGSEQFSWVGGIPDDFLGYKTEGSGGIGTITCSSGGQSLLADPSFENWSGGQPSSWPVTVGSSLIQQNTTAANLWRGLSSVQITGDGATAACTIQSAAIPNTQLTGLRRYLVAVMLKASAVPAAGTFTMNFTGTGYAAASLTNQQQTVTVSGTPTGGNYKINWTGPYGGAQVTANIAYNGSAAAVQAALRALAGLESVVVTQSGSTPNFTNTITMYGVPGNPAQFTVTDNTSGGSHAIAPATTVTGVEGEQVSLPATAFPTTWALRYFWINLPVIVPAALTLNLQMGSTLSNGVQVWLDDAVFDPVNYGAGLGINVLSGNTPWLINDQLSWTVANNQGGNFQEMWRRCYGVQMPSVASSPSISDALA